MSTPHPLQDRAAARALAWRHDAQAAVCDVIEPWAHGTVVRATRYPSYFDFNVVRVEDDPPLTVDALAAFADEALAGLAHRRVDFDLIAPGERLRAAFVATGWKATRLVWMRRVAPVPPMGRDMAVEEVPYDAVNDLRLTWHREQFADDPDPDAYHRQSREVAMRRQVRILAARDHGLAVAYAQLERDGPAAEITQVYVHPDFRGAGRGTAMTRAAMEAAGDVADLWIVADDEDRPKQLYARLGFRPAWTAMEFLRLP